MTGKFAEEREGKKERKCDQEKERDKGALTNLFAMNLPRSGVSGRPRGPSLAWPQERERARDSD